MFAGKSLFPSPFHRELRYALDTYYLADPARGIRQAEDLLLVLADRRYRSALPKLFPGSAGRVPIDFIATWGIVRGDRRAIRRLLFPLVANERALFPERDLYGIIARLLQTAEALCERGIAITDAAGQPTRLGGFWSDATERQAGLGALLGSGPTRIVLDDFRQDTFSFQTAPLEDPAPPPRHGADFFQALAAGQTVADAIVTAGFVSAGLRDVFKGAAALKRRLSAPKQAKRRRIRVRPVR